MGGDMAEDGSTSSERDLAAVVYIVNELREELTEACKRLGRVADKMEQTLERGMTDAVYLSMQKDAGRWGDLWAVGIGASMLLVGVAVGAWWL
jgi:hypothetical protein